MTRLSSTTYGRILARPGALAFSTAGLIARFPMSMVGISTVLAVQALYGSYTAAGAAAAANIVGVAVGSPMLARLVDIHGQRRVMLPSMLVSATCLAALVVAAQVVAPLTLVIVLSALAGGLAGSMGSLVRSRWTVVLKTPDDIHTAFSLEAALDETAFIVGPVLATALCTSPWLPVTSGWIAALAMQVGGSLWFLSQRATEPQPHPRAGRRRRRESSDPARQTPVEELAPQPPAPVLGNGAVRAIIVIFAFTGAMLGANDVTVVAFATEVGHKDQTGVALAAWALGSLVAALAYGARSWGWPLWKQLALGLVWLALGATTFLAAPNLPVLCVLYVISGLGIAPTLTSGNNIVQASVDGSQLTEGLAWVGTSLNIGVSVGSFVAGLVLDADGARGGYLLVAACGWLAALAMVPGLRSLRRASSHRSLD